MMRAMVAATVPAVAFPAVADAAELTPAGPATLTPAFGPNVGCPAISLGRAVIVDVGTGALDAEITVRTISGKTPVTAKTTVLR